MKPRIIIALLALAFLPACNTLRSIDQVTSYETSPQSTDQIILDAQKTTAIAAETFNEFLILDRRYEVLIKAKVPEVHTAAEYLRAQVDYQPLGGPLKQLPRGVMWLKKARDATKAFQNNRTADGKANLITVINTVKDLIRKSKDNIVQIQALKAP